ncbi:PilN domain-containing protein [Marinospirillum insulare]|uniref:Pilus assembly protein PilN n=1 Tax=Marinospirillum insulare TaxID=217169 RepID=A0ABQ5ZUM1_9GAMM|nr:PilN domain-containing protein [Marinospirillum insulare]GLR63694.1 pilus assembly protein PilN [Marinospirillum insulare]
MNLNTGINLRPWREERRQKQQQTFTQLSLLALVVGLLISVLLWQSTTASIAVIQDENQLIKNRMTKLDAEIREVANLREKRQQLLNRIGVIQKLQDNRSVTVEIMDQLASSINNGVYLTEIERDKNQILIEGSASPSQAVAAWMRNLKEQPRFSEPVLRSLTTDDQSSLTHFNLLLPLRDSKQ